MKNRWLLGLVVLVVLTQFTGCGGGGGGPTDPSTAPVLSGIAVRPNPANAGANMILEIQYVDVNADLNDGIAYITDSQGYSYTGQVSNAPGTSGTLVTTFALAYELNKRKLPEMARTSGLWFMSMAFVFPVMYLTLTPLAIATLGTSSWETRGHGAARKKAGNGVAAAARIG